jgi:hypothetical protein
MNVDTLLVGAVPLMVVIFGLVEFIKSFGLSGRILTVISLVIGLGFGIAFHVYQAGVPTDFVSWFEACVFGLSIGLVVSGFYDFANARFPARK